MALIELEKVSRVYQSGEHALKALDEVDLQLEEGKFVVILGPSGAGKSTLLNLLGGLDSPTSGKITVDGMDISRLTQNELADYRAAKVGFVFQFYNLIPTLTVHENVTLVREIAPHALSATQMLEEVGLSDHLRSFPSELSGGEQQRVALARALANNADLIIADEPTGNVDPRMSLEIVDLLMRLNSEGTTVIMVTHEHNLVRMYDKRVILLENGTVAADGKMKNSAHREIKIKGSLGRPADGFATKYLDDEDEEAGKPGKLSEKAAEIADETAADDAYRQALESFGKEKAEYGSEYDTSYSSVAADYSIYLEDGEGDESDEK